MKHAAMVGASLFVGVPAHAAELKAVAEPLAAVSLAQQTMARLSLASEDNATLAVTTLKSSVAQPVTVKLSADDQAKILKDEKKISANDKTIAKAAPLSDDKGVVEKAEAVVADETKSMNVAMKNGNGEKILAVAKDVLKEQASFEASLMASDRQNLLEHNRVRSDNEYTVAVLTDLGTLKAMPDDVDSLAYWRDATGSVKAVDFYGERGELFAVSPQAVIQSYATVAGLGSGEKIVGDAILKEVFNETKPILEKFGVAGLFGEMAYLQKFKGEPGFSADVRSLDKLILNFGGRGGISPVGLNPIVLGSTTIIPTAAVPEPATWSLMLVGVSVLGAALRRRHGPERALPRAELTTELPRAAESPLASRHSGRCGRLLPSLMSRPGSGGGWVKRRGGAGG